MKQFFRSLNWLIQILKQMIRCQAFDSSLGIPTDSIRIIFTIELKWFAIIEREKADVVFLQEVISSTERVLRKYLKRYSYFSGYMNCVDYYTLTLIRKNNVNFESNQILEYEKTWMGRNLIKTRVNMIFSDLQILIIWNFLVIYLLIYLMIGEIII
jgi:exonuclease III